MPEKEKIKLTRRELARQAVKEMEFEFFKSFSTMIISAFGLVAALAWNELVKTWIQRYIAPGETIKSQLIYATAVTALAGLVAWQLGRMAKKLTQKQVTKKDIEKALEEQKNGK